MSTMKNTVVYYSTTVSSGHWLGAPGHIRARALSFWIFAGFSRVLACLPCLSRLALAANNIQ